MGFLDSLFGNGVGAATQGVGELAKDIRQAVTGELPPEIRAKEDELFLQATEKSDDNQTGLLKQDIISGSFLQRGWRPMAGWVCVTALAYEYLIFPMLVWMSLNKHWATPPTIDGSTLNTLLFGMLGLTAARSVEKWKHIDSNGSKS